jgi:DNA phosphorothioation-associated putative methyltransferase
LSPSDFKDLVSRVNYGKHLADALYVIRPQELTGFSPRLLEEFARAEKAACPRDDWNLLKLHKREYAITFLSYPDFDTDPHPALKYSTKINLNSGRIVRTDYTGRANPPILHRKETFLPEGDSRRDLFADLTKKEVELGLYRDPSRIGLRLFWVSLLRKKNLYYEGHVLVDSSSKQEEAVPDDTLVERHRTAIKRYDLSKPVKLLMKNGLIRKGQSFFDYGCGHGMDVEGLQSLGFSANGWDPAFRPDAEKLEAKVVNLGYVLNVIETPPEREEVLRGAFSLVQELLLVSVMSRGQENEAHTRPMGDGFITKTGTFQKFYAPGELEDLIEKCLEREPVTLALGICLVFRDEAIREQFLSTRTRRRVDWANISSHLRFSQPSKREEQQVGRYELHRDLMDGLWDCLLDLGRAPEAGEFARVDELMRSTGGLKRSIALALNYHGTELFKEARRLREEDLLVYLAMKHFERRFLRKHLPDRMRRDIKSFFGDFDKAKQKSIELLFASGDVDEIQLAISELDFGWYDKGEGHYSFHRSLLDQLPGVLRVYVFCGLRRFGNLDEVDLIKIHIGSGKLTLQRYDDFDSKPFPELELRVKIDLRRDFVTVFDHSTEPDGQPLYFKDRFLRADDPRCKEAETIGRRFANLGFSKETIGFGPSKSELLGLLEEKGLTEKLIKRRSKT